MPIHLVLLLDAPWMAWGGEVIDAYGVVRDFPGRSTITGLLANALGYDRAEGERLDRLQARLVMGSARLAEGHRVRDFQTAQLDAGDRGWTMRGRLEGRAGGAGTYAAPHIRYRDADADALLLVVLRLDPADEAPTLPEVAAALDRPERPLFLGRKPCLPSRPVLADQVETDTVHDALAQARVVALSSGTSGDRRALVHRSRLAPGELMLRRRMDVKASVRAQWPEGEGPHRGEDQARTIDLCDERNWLTGVHGGQRRVVEGHLPERGARDGGTAT